MATVRAKFKIQSHVTTKTPYAETMTVTATPVSDSDPKSENGKFWAATPNGKLELACTNIAAAELLEVGKDYYLDFTLAE